MNNYQEISMNDIIFENRNKQYGAYQLRQNIDRHSVVGLLSTISVFAILLIIYNFNPFQTNKIIEQQIVNVTTTEFNYPKPEIEQQKHTTPPPQTRVNTDEFKEMKVVNNTVATTTIASQTEIFDKQIGTETITDGIDKTNTTIAEVTTNTTSSEIAETTILKTEVSDKILSIASEMPSYNGGKAAMMEYLSKNIKPFYSDVEAGISGKVILRFYVDVDGTVKNPEVLKDNIGGRCAEAAIAAIKKMPKWKAGKQNGIPVRVYFTLPVTFNFSRN